MRTLAVGVGAHVSALPSTTSMSQTGGGGGAIPIRRPSLVQAKLAAEAKQAAEKMSVKFHGDGGDGDSGSRHGSFIEHGGSTRKLDAMKARLSYSAGTQAREGPASSLGEGGQRSELRRVFRAFDGDNGFEIEPQEFQAALMALGFEGAEGKRLSCNTRAHTRPSWSRPHGDALFPVFARPLLPLCLLPPSRPWSHLPDPGLSPVLPPYPRTPAIRSLPHPFPFPHHLPHTHNRQTRRPSQRCSRRSIRVRTGRSARTSSSDSSPTIVWRK